MTEIAVLRKQCPHCMVEKIAETGFDRDSEGDLGFARLCKKCTQDQQTAEFNEKVAKQVEMLDKSSLALLQKISKNGGINSVALPHAATLLEDLMTVWGGSLGFSQHMLAEFLAAPVGSPTRQKYMLAILGLTKFVSQEGYVLPDLDTMDDKQLEELKVKQLERIVAEMGDKDD